MKWSLCVVMVGWVAATGCAPPPDAPPPRADASAYARPPSRTDPAVLLADLVVQEQTLTLADVSALALHLPATRSLTVEGRAAGEPMPSGFFELNGAVIGTPPSTAGVHVKLTVERGGEALVTVSEQAGAVVVDCAPATSAGLFCWADVWAWVPADASLSIGGEGMDSARLTELEGALFVGLPWVHHLEVEHRGDATVWLGEVDAAGHVQLCVDGDVELQIDDGTDPLGC